MNLDPTDYNYIDGENIYPLQDYIDEKITSNIYTNNVYITPTKKLNDVIYYSLNNLIIDNNTPFGEIQFKTSSSYPEDNTKIGTIIDFTGKLKVYHNYNILQPAFVSGYYDVENELLQLKADGINTDIQLGVLEAGGVYLQEQITIISEALLTTNYKVDNLIYGLTNQQEYELLAEIASSQNITDATNGFKTLIDTYNATANTAYYRAIGLGVIGGVAIGLGGAVLGYLQTTRQENIASNILKANVNLTEAEKGTILSDNIIIQSNISNIQNFNVSISNLIINQGFINCNIQTTQTIPSISTNSITIGGTPLTTTLNNYVLKSGSTMTGLLDILIGTDTAIQIRNPTPSSTASMRFTNNNNLTSHLGFGCLSYTGIYANNFYIQSPTSLILNAGGVSGGYTPFFIITSSGKIGISATDTTTYRFNINGSLNATTIYRNGAEIDATYLKLIGGTLTGGLIGTTLNLSGSLTTNSIIYNTQELSTSLSYYLLKTGGTLTGSILFNTQLFGDPGAYPQGFNGDRIILQPGISPSGYPYSVGINTDVFWNCAPSTASYKWYSGATNTMTLNNTGNLSISSINATRPVSINFTGYTGNHLLILTNDNTSTYPMIKLTNNTNGDGFMGIGGYYGQNYFGNFFLKATNSLIFNTGANNETNVPYMIILPNGNVGISSLSPTTKLDVNGSIKSTSLTTPSIIYNGTELSNAYLKLSGGTMSGQITGITTLSATTGYFGTLATTNNTNVGAVGIGTYGGTGDKLILWAGSGSAYPYSLGINASELWYSVPSGATHKFYVGGSNMLMIDSSGKIGIGTNNPYTLFHMKGTNPALTIMAQGAGGATSQLNLSTYDTITFLPNCSLIATDNGSFGASFQINQKIAGANSNSQFTSFYISPSGNVGIGNPLSTQPLWIGRPDVVSDGAIVVSKNNGGGNRNFRMAYDTNFNFCFGDYGNANNNTNQFKSQFLINYQAPSNCITINASGNVGMGVASASANCKLDVRGVVNITNTNPYAVPTGFMQAGSLTIGDVLLDYGCQYYGNSWTGNNTAGLLLECANNTEIAVHDSANRLVSLMAYYGGTVNVIEIGRSMASSAGWAKPAIQIKNYTSIEGNLTVFGRLATNQFYTTTNNQIITNTISIAPTSTAYNGYWQIDINAYKIENQYNYLIFSCSVNYAGTTGYWTGRILVNGNGFGSIISVADFNTTNIYLSWINLSGILYLWVNANGFYPTTNSLLYYKIIG